MSTSAIALDSSALTIAAGSKFTRPRFWLIPALFLLLVGVSLTSGFTSVQGTSYWSAAQVFEDFMNSSIRMLFPIVVALLAGADIAPELSYRYIVNTRARQDVRRRLAGLFAAAVTRTFIVFALVTLVNAIMAFVVVPAVWPHAIDPRGYDLMTPAAVHASDTAIAPLTAMDNAGWVMFAVAAACWAGWNAAVFGLLTLICVVLAPRVVLALLIPMGLYQAESIIFMFLGIPGSAFLISALYPAGLQHYSLLQAAVPTLILTVIVSSAAVVLIRRAPSCPGMS